MKPSRRTMLLGGGAVVLAGAAVGTPAILNAGRPEVAVAAVVRRVFGSDVASAKDIEAFAKAYVARRRFGVGRAGRFLAAGAPQLLPVLALASGRTSLEKIGSHLEKAEADVTKDFILSTNYAHRRPGKPVTFEAIADYHQPFACLNPIARFDFDD